MNWFSLRKNRILLKLSELGKNWGKYQFSLTLQRKEHAIPIIENENKAIATINKLSMKKDFFLTNIFIKNIKKKFCFIIFSKIIQNKISAIIMQNCIKAKLEAINIESTSEVWKIWKILIAKVDGVDGASNNDISITEAAKAMTINITNLIFL